MRETVNIFRHSCDYKFCSQNDIEPNSWTLRGILHTLNSDGSVKEVNNATLRFCSQEHRDEFIRLAK